MNLETFAQTLATHMLALAAEEGVRTLELFHPDDRESVVEELINDLSQRLKQIPNSPTWKNSLQQVISKKIKNQVIHSFIRYNIAEPSIRIILSSDADLPVLLIEWILSTDTSRTQRLGERIRARIQQPITDMDIVTNEEQLAINNAISTVLECFYKVVVSNESIDRIKKEIIQHTLAYIPEEVLHVTGSTTPSTIIFHEAKTCQSVLSNLEIIDGTTCWGRDREIETIRELFKEGHDVSIVAADKKINAGIGKTFLAVEFARRHRTTNFPGGTYFINASTEERLKSGIAAISEYIVKMPGQFESDNQRIECVRQRVGQEAPALLILDDMTEKTVETFRDVLPEKGSVRILITSRLTEIPHTKEVSLASLDRVSANSMLTETCGELLSEEEHQAVQEISGFLLYHPLSLFVARGYLGCKNTAMKFSKYREVLRSGIDRMKQELSELPGETKTKLPVLYAGLFLTLQESMEIFAQDQYMRRIFDLVGLIDDQYSISPVLLINAAATNETLIQDPRRALDLLIKTNLITAVHRESDGSLRITTHPLIHNYISYHLNKDHSLELRIYEKGFIKSLADFIDRDQMEMYSEYETINREMPHVFKAFEIACMQEHRVPDLVRTMAYNLGKWFFIKSAIERATEYYQIGKECSMKYYPRQESFIGMMDNAIGVALREASEYDESLQFFKRSIALFEKSLGKEHPVIATVANNIAVVLQEKGDIFTPIYHLNRVLNIDLKTFGDEHPTVARDLINIANLYLLRGSPDAAIDNFKKALAIEEKVLGKEHPRVATRLSYLAWLYQLKDNLDEAIEYLRRALLINQKQYGRYHSSVEQNLSQIAALLQEKGEFEEAIEYYNAALAIEQKTRDNNPEYIAQTLNKMATAYHIKGDLDSALKHYKEALSIDEKVYGEDSADVAEVLKSIGEVLKEKGDRHDALVYLQKALYLFSKRLGQSHPIVGSLYNHIGILLFENGEYESSLSHLKKALEIEQTYLPPDHPQIATSLNNIAAVCHAISDYESALDLYEKALRILESQYSGYHADIAAALNNMALVLQDKGDHSTALDHLKRALRIDRQLFGDIHHTVAADLHNIGMLLKEMGEDNRSKKYFREALEIYKSLYGDEHPRVQEVIRNMSLGGN